MQVAIAQPRVMTRQEAAELVRQELGWDEGNTSCVMQSRNARVRILEQVRLPYDPGRYGWTEKSVRKFIQHFRRHKTT
jgi:hypothetical protein